MLTANVFTLLMLSAEAHSGRTDFKGGHKDTKTGTYHYHCGGYPAHQHKNGICPYKTNTAKPTPTPTPLPTPTPTPKPEKNSKYYKMYVHFINVGNLDCVLIESNGKYMLIDAGDDDDEDTIIDYLKKEKVKKLDNVICTHPHADHIGSMDDVIEEFNIGKVIMPNITHNSETLEDLLDAIAMGIRATVS